MKKFRIACIQLNTGNNLENNISKVEKFIDKAALLGADVIFLPENAFFMPKDNEELLQNARFTEDDLALKFISKKALELNKWINIGSISVKEKDSEKLYNRSLLLNNKGIIVATYDKIHLYDASLNKGESHQESKLYNSGSKIITADIGYCKLGMSICYDLRFPHLFRSLAHSGAEVISVPSAFTKYTGNLHWHVLLRSRAIENTVYIISPAQTGSHPSGRETYGHSIVVDPWGNIIAELGSEEDVLIADIDLNLVSEVRSQLPSLSQDRKFS